MHDRVSFGDEAEASFRAHPRQTYQTQARDCKDRVRSPRLPKKSKERRKTSVATVGHSEKHLVDNRRERTPNLSIESEGYLGINRPTRGINQYGSR